MTDLLQSLNLALTYGWLFIDVDANTAVSDVLAAAQPLVASYQLPPRYSVSWSGQYESMQRVQDKLKTVVPITLVIIFMLLYVTFKSFKQALLIMVTLPLALSGSLWLVWALGFNLSTAVGVGMIALAGVAAEFGVVMMLYLNQALAEARRANSKPSLAELQQAIMHGAVQRVRPKAMTVLTIIAGLLPIMLSEGTGSEVMQRIAAPMIGGMIVAPLLSLLVIPAVYWLYLKRW